MAQQDRAQADPLGGRNRAGEGRGEPAFGQHFPNPLGRSFFEMNGNAWVARAVLVKQAAEKRLRRRPDVTEAQLAFLAGGGAPDAAHRFLPPFEEDRCFAQQHSARRRQTHLAAVSVQEGGAQLRLHVLHRPAQCRLRDPQMPRGPRVAQLLGHRLKIAKLPEIHGELMVESDGWPSSLAGVL